MRWYEQKKKFVSANMGEQPGFMGIGKFEVDVYYNDIKHRMQTVRSKLEKAGKQRELHRQGRKRMGFKTISLSRLYFCRKNNIV